MADPSGAAVAPGASSAQEFRAKAIAAHEAAGTGATQAGPGAVNPPVSPVSGPAPYGGSNGTGQTSSATGTGGTGEMPIQTTNGAVGGAGAGSVGTGSTGSAAGMGNPK